jgi:hypothetical protein
VSVAARITSRLEAWVYVVSLGALPVSLAGIALTSMADVTPAPFVVLLVASVLIFTFRSLVRYGPSTFNWFREANWFGEPAPILTAREAIGVLRGRQTS